MKFFITGTVVIFLFMQFVAFQDSFNRMEREVFSLKIDAEEVAAAAAQYIDEEEYAEGRIVFDQVEALRAAEYLIKSRMRLDDHFDPLPGTYWTERIRYRIEFFDESNTTFPFLYHHESSDFVETIRSPSVVVTLYGGKVRIVFFESPDLYRAAAHAWKEW